MKYTVVCENCQHQQPVFISKLQRNVMGCTVRPGRVAEQVVCSDYAARVQQVPVQSDYDVLAEDIREVKA
jgi:hypothetical protein